MTHPEIDYSRKWYVMGAVGMGMFLSTLDGSIVNIALPTIVRELNTDFATVQWVVLGYMLTLVTLLLSIGRLADMIGKKPLYATGFVIFTTGSALCGIAPSVYWLIGFRVFQAIGASMVTSLGSAIITEAFPPSERGKALGTGGSIVSVGLMTGPTLGGLIIHSLSWRWIFYINLPVGIIGTLMVLKFVPHTRSDEKQSFDFVGAAVLFISLTSFLLALTWGQKLGFTEGRILGLFAVWAVFLVVFLVIESRVEQPMIEFRLFENSLFSINLVTGFLSFVALGGVVILMPFYLQDLLGYDTRMVGLMMATLPVAMGVTAPIAGSWSDRFGTRPIAVVGLAVIAAGFYAVSTLGEDAGIAGYMLRFAPVGIGMGIFQSPNNSAILGSVPRQRLGIASGLLSITRVLGQTSGLAILGAFWAARVMYYAGGIVEGGATAAPASAQVAGLTDTFLISLALIFFGLLLGIWAFVQERRTHAGKAAVAAANPNPGGCNE